VREHLAKQELQAANTALEEAVTHDANEELVERLRYQLREAGEHLKLVNQQKSLIPDQSTPEHASAARGVLRALAAIPATSPFYTDAARVTDRAKLQLIDIWLKQAYVMAGEGDAAGARSYAQKVIDLELAYCQQREGCDEEEATNAEAVAVLDDLNEEVALADTPSSDTPSADTPSSDTPSADTPSSDTPSSDTPSADTPSSDTPSGDTPSADTPSSDTPSSDTPSSDTPSSDTPSSDTPSVERPRRRPRPEYERANFRQGYRFYGRKRFDQAITHFQRIARGNKYRRRDRRRASSMVDKIQSFKRLYGQANAAVAAYQPTTAIRLLDQARTLDRQINGAFGGEIRRNLSSMYAYRAAGAYTSRRYREAARFARKALNYNPGESSARLIYERVDAKVEALLAQARSAVNSGASQRARGLLNQVLGIVSQTDPRYRTATSLLNSLMIDQAEEDDD
jgi:tetratricopeptide (TPR) repeat protein